MESIIREAKSINSYKIKVHYLSLLQDAEMVVELNEQRSLQADALFAVSMDVIDYNQRKIVSTYEGADFISKLNQQIFFHNLIDQLPVLHQKIFENCNQTFQLYLEFYHHLKTIKILTNYCKISKSNPT